MTADVTKRLVQGQRYGFNPVVTPAWKALRAVWSLAESELYPWDREVVRAIREVLPEFVPVNRRSVWKTGTGELVKLTHHCLGFRSDDPNRPRLKRQYLWPTNPASVNYGLNASNDNIIIEKILEGPTSTPVLPGAFRPLGWGVYYQVVHARYLVKRLMSVAREEERTRRHERDTTEALKAKVYTEIDERVNHYAPELKRSIDHTSDLELKQMEQPVPIEKTPFVTVA